MGRGATMKVIQEAIARLESEKAAFNARIDGRIEGLKDALRLQGGGTMATFDAPERRARRGNVKDTVLALIEEAGERGLTTEECVLQGKSQRGVSLVSASVSSLLSRLKSDNVLFYDGSRYRLRRFAGPREAA